MTERLHKDKEMARREAANAEPPRLLYISTVLSSAEDSAIGLFNDDGFVLSLFSLFSLFSLSLPKLCLAEGKSELGRGVSTEMSFSIGAPALESKSVCTEMGCMVSSATLASGLEMGPLGLTPFLDFCDKR
jgi:hypothetical protein